MEFSPEQRLAIEKVEQGLHVFISGPAGSGKSTILQELKRRDRNLPVTGSTGIAAVNVGGTTLHSWAGLGLLKGTADDIARHIRKERPAARKNIMGARRLAIDEVSMLSARALDTIDRVFQIIRSNPRPFGGIQMILFGDFLQMPPVGTPGTADAKMAFEAEVWASVRTVMLHRIFRQEDGRFAQALNDLRMGRYSDLAAELLMPRVQREDPERETKPPVIIGTHNSSVDEFNAARLAEIPGKTEEFRATDAGCESARTLLSKHCQAPDELVLKVGARVMLLINSDVENGLVNGRAGFVTGFSRDTGAPIVEFDNGLERQIEAHTWDISEGDKLLGTRKQVPLKLAWAVTSHKCQGTTLDKIEVHLADVFEAGQAYVALSRVRTLDGLFIANGNKNSIRAHEKALAFYEKLTEKIPE